LACVFSIESSHILSDETPEHVRPMGDAGNSVQPFGSGEARSGAEMLPLVYNELRRLAAARLAQEPPGQTLQATALVHEAWLRLEHAHQSWQDPRQFFSAAAEAMRRILVENARRKRRTKDARHGERVELDLDQIAAPLPDEDLLALDEALDELGKLDPSAVTLVKLRFFAGLTHARAAEQMGISHSAADRTWLFARSWLFRHVHLRDDIH
jgi:RNA polymerase sigma factor (TIGR02999 family)